MKTHTSQVTLLAVATVAGLLAAWSLARMPAVLAAPVPDPSAAPSARPAIPISTTISGIVTLPDGSLPVPDGTIVWLYKPDPDLETDVRGSSTVVTSTGAYSFAGIEPGKYILRAKPPDLAPFTYAPSYWTPVEVLNSPVDVDLRLTYPSITGTVFAPDGVTPSHAIVHVTRPTEDGPVQVEVRYSSDGTFTFGGIPTGTYTIVAEPWATDHQYWWSKAVNTPITPTTAPDTAQFVTLTLQAPQVFGVVDDPTHSPVLDARVDVVAANGTHRFELTDPQGRFAIDSLPGGMTATVSVEPPIGLGWLVEPTPQVVTLPDGSPLTFTLGFPNDRLIGSVHTNQVPPQAVSGALVEAHRVDRPGSQSATTSASGAYTMPLAPGLWRVDVSPVSTTVPNSWFFPSEARLVEFRPTFTGEVKTLNFDVILADASVNGSVQLPDGSTPPFTVTVRLHSDEGIGASQKVGGTGHFSINLPHGVYQMDLLVDSPLFAAPPVQVVRAGAGGPTNVGAITLLARDAIIKGTLSNSSTLTPVADIRVIAWNPTTKATFHTRSGSDGIYVMAVYSGTWIVRPVPQPDQPYVFTGSPADVTIVTGQIINNVNFGLTPADATIHGLLVDDKGNLVPSAHGFAGAQSSDRSVRAGAPIAGGEFDILVPAGTYTVSLQLPDDQRYMSNGQSQQATVSAGNTTTVTFTLARKTALLWGALLNKRTGASPAGLDGEVWAWDQGMFADTDAHPDGLFNLPVAPGLWRLNYAVDPDSNWIKTDGPRSYGVQAGQQQFVPLPVVRKDALLTGTVVLGDGVTPARGAAVVVEALTRDIAGLSLRALVNDDGSFSLKLPGGMYHVHATPLPGQINPAIKDVAVPSGGSASVKLQYRQPDAMLVGSVSSGSPVTSPVDIWAFSGDDGYSFTRARNGGTYTLPVVSGQTWYVRAVAETRSSYWIERTSVSVTVPGPTVLNLNLTGPLPKPAPVTVVFDSSQDELVSLGDGTRIFIPAGTMPATGDVILHITPLAAVPHERLGDVFGLAYAFEAYSSDGHPLTQNFNGSVAITFEYDPAQLLAWGLNINHVRPAYFSTTTNSWTRPDSYVVDQDDHEITMQVDHFTQMALVDAPADVSNDLFLPMITR